MTHKRIEYRDIKGGMTIHAALTKSAHNTVIVGRVRSVGNYRTILIGGPDDYISLNVAEWFFDEVIELPTAPGSMIVVDNPEEQVLVLDPYEGWQSTSGTAKWAEAEVLKQFNRVLWVPRS